MNPIRSCRHSKSDLSATVRVGASLPFSSSTVDLANEGFSSCA